MGIEIGYNLYHIVALIELGDLGQLNALRLSSHLF